MAYNTTEPYPVCPKCGGKVGLPRDNANACGGPLSPCKPNPQYDPQTDWPERHGLV